MKYLLYAVLSCLFIQSALAQQHTIKGDVRSASDSIPFPNVTVSLLHAQDSLVVRETVTQSNGSFELDEVEEGDYLIRVQYLGYDNTDKPIEIDDDIDVGTLYLHEGARLLDEITITGRPPVGKQRGDTTEFNAGAFQTMKDASAQNLIEKMPGMGNEDGNLQAQGENITQILVDGKPFFGTDVKAALQNLPAEIIQSIQVFDKLSDEAEASGFDDGERLKTINIITKPNSRKGLFGKSSAGYGDSERYMVGASVNAFNEGQRLTITGLTNNINAVDFSADPNSQGEARPQNGIINTNRIGLNYTDNWGEKIEVNASYLFNHRKNFGESSLLREYVLPDSDGQRYTESSTNTRRNAAHRFNMRFEYQIDSNNRILFRPNFSTQSDNENSFFNGNTLTDSGPLNQTGNQRLADNSDLNFNSRLFYSRRFAKKGRSLRVGLVTGNQKNDDDANRQAENIFFDPAERVENISQQIVRVRKGFNWQANAAYTEPFGKNGIVEFEYQIGTRTNDSDQLTYDTDNMGNQVRLDTALSNTFNSDYLTQEAEIGYQYSLEKLRVQVEAEFQHAQLKNDQEFPSVFALQRTFRSVMPSLRLDYKFTDSKNLEFDYDARTNAPGIGDLQSVIDNSNPLHLRTGNPDLDQSYSNRFNLRYRSYNSETQRTFFAMVRSTVTSNNVVTSTTIAEAPIELADGIILERGSQLTRPVNLDGYWDLRSFFHYGLPVHFLPSNFNFHGGISYTNSPGMINDQVNAVKTTRYNGGISLSSNISDRMDFNIWTRSSYNTVQNSLRPTLNNNYFNQTTRINFNWILWQNLVYRLDVNHQLNTGLSEGYDNSILLANMSIGKKLLRNERAEVSVNVYDLFGQNNNIRRDITETYIQDSQSNVLQRYFMLSFTYNIRYFAKGTTIDDYEKMYN
ncbi:outer membrane beta-barrel protein [Parapedobacter koreensis]|uniref:Carboxypeptidase regulatory-like domain-containing protein n=1 Tax=Parapedobacter koreensis TaxID=332977 RepID=A0A1H7PEB1_9SPHI|nr:outer membrane beta-barrel protein [Parapedobacter koreensis]SEL34110.1 Carboxypeptidase regulatory-like domain-containing protein [Parapedobacter koreensis]